MSIWIGYSTCIDLGEGCQSAVAVGTHLLLCVSLRFPGAPYAADFSRQPGYLLKQLLEQDTPAPMTSLFFLSTQEDFQIPEFLTVNSLDCHRTPWLVHLAAHMSPERPHPLRLGRCLCSATAMGAHHANYKRQQPLTDLSRALKGGEGRGERRREERILPALPPCPKEAQRTAEEEPTSAVTDRAGSCGVRAAGQVGSAAARQLRPGAAPRYGAAGQVALPAGDKGSREKSER